MSITLLNTRTQATHYWRGSSGSLVETADISSTLTGAVERWVQHGYYNGSYTYAALGMSSESSYAGLIAGRSSSTEITASGDAGSFSGTVANADGSFVKNSFIGALDVLDAATAADPSASCSLTTYANQIPGASYTNATLYAKLQQLYPGMHSFYVLPTVTGNINFVVTNPTNVGMSDLYGFHDGTIDDLVCANAPGVSNLSTLPATVVFSGGDIDGNPDILEGNNWASAGAFCMWLLLSEQPPAYKVQVDMYFEGTDSPNIDVKWSYYKNGQEIPDPQNDEYLDACRLLIRCFAASSDMVTVEGLFDYIDEETDLRVMSNGAPDNRFVDFNFLLPSSDYIHTQFNSVADEISKTYDTATKILVYGITGKPSYLVWLFQIEETANENGIQYSEMWRLREPRKFESLYPDHTLTEFDDAKTEYSKIDLEVILHTGSSREDEEQDDDDNDDDDDDSVYPTPPDPDPWDDEEGIGFPGKAVLTRTYSMTEGITANVGSKLWSQSYFDVLKIQSNPIENIVSCKWYPFDLTDGTDTEIKVGDVAFGINGKLIPSIKVIDIGSVSYTGKYQSFLDSSPYTSLKLHLPYVGVVQLDAGDFRGTTISVQYIIDLVTGECMARVKRDGIPYEDYTGRMGVDIPLTSSDRVQTEMKALQSGIHTGAALVGNMINGDVVGAVAGAASGAMSVAGMDYSTQRSASPSSACGSYQNHAVWLEIMVPEYYVSSGFNTIIGRPVNRFMRLAGNFEDNDFVQVDQRADINIAMTGDENAELEALLTTGVYI